MKNYKIFLRQKNETWQDALDRFFRFRETDMKEYFSNKDYSYRFADNKAYDYYPQEKVSNEYFEEFSSLNNINIPIDLKNLLNYHGGFLIGSSLIEIYSKVEESTIFYTLPQILDEYGYKNFVEKISPGVLRSLSKYYYFFGVSFPESEEIGFLYFNKAGNFGKMLFAPDNENLVLKKILPSMFNGSIEKFTLNELISIQIDRIITNALTVKGYIE